MDLKDYIDNLIKQSGISEDFDRSLIVDFLQDNNWFDYAPDFSKGKVELEEDQMELFTPPLLKFLSVEDRTSNTLLSMLTDKWPETSAFLEKYFQEESYRIDESARFHVTDFLLYRMNKEVEKYNNDDIETLCTLAASDLTKSHGDLLTDFLSWLRTETNTKYNIENRMNRRYVMTDQNEAYDIKTYLRLMYLILNEDYIRENDMYMLAAEDKNYTDTWLYLALHFVCSLRQSDFESFPHPILADNPEIVLEKIATDRFTDTEALRVLTSFTNYLNFFRLTPNKTKNTQGVNEIKIEISTSCEVHYGKLFALAEAHWQIAGNAEAPLIRKINTYQQITNYMGEEIGELFLERDFGARSATKSYLQSILTFGESELSDDGLNIKGYILASYARSHKGSYYAFAESTMIYLRDCKMAGITPEMAAFELLNRGVLSHVLSMLLEMLIGKEKYHALTLSKQTELMHELDLETFEAEKIVTAVADARDKASLVAQDLFGNFSSKNLLEAMHKIGNGMAKAKTDTDDCILHALDVRCPYAGRKVCVGCDYELFTRSTFLHYIDEYNRMLRLYKTSLSEQEKRKYKGAIQEDIQPALIEMLRIFKEEYGKDVYERYKNILKERLDD